MADRASNKYMLNSNVRLLEVKMNQVDQNQVDQQVYDKSSR